MALLLPEAKAGGGVPELFNACWRAVCCVLQIKFLISDLAISASWHTNYLFTYLFMWEIFCMHQKIFLAGGKTGQLTQEIKVWCSLLQWAVFLRKKVWNFNEIPFGIRRHLQWTDISQVAKKVFRMLSPHGSGMPPALYYTTWHRACTCHVTWNVGFGEKHSRSHTSLFNNRQL